MLNAAFRLSLVAAFLIKSVFMRVCGILDTQKFTDMLPRSVFGCFPELVGGAEFRAIRLK